MAAKLKKRALAEYNSQVVHVDPQLQEKRLKITGGDSRSVSCDSSASAGGNVDNVVGGPIATAVSALNRLLNNGPEVQPHDKDATPGGPASASQSVRRTVTDILSAAQGSSPEDTSSSILIAVSTFNTMVISRLKRLEHTNNEADTSAFQERQNLELLVQAMSDLVKTVGSAGVVGSRDLRSSLPVWINLLDKQRDPAVKGAILGLVYQWFQVAGDSLVLLPDTGETLWHCLRDDCLTRSSQNYLLKVGALNVLGSGTAALAANDRSLGSEILGVVGAYAQSQDPRVRHASFVALLALHSKGFALDTATLYPQFCTALEDDYEGVRSIALNLIHVLAMANPDEVIKIKDTSTCRLVDDAFGKICSGVNDLSVQVREESMKLLGSMRGISQSFLEQTLDKKLMSNMREKKSAHEREAKKVSAGEWSSGKNWADDAPAKDELRAEEVRLISFGACGAFVHGLEDEFMCVRTASVESLTRLSIENSHMAALALDFLVDMFNDEIEAVRLKAIDALTRIANHISLQVHQLETIMSALDDYSMTVREKLHVMLQASTIATKDGMRNVIGKLLENIKKYPQDKRSILMTFRKLGLKHANLTLPLVTQLLEVHPFFDTAEPDIEDSNYLCILVLVYNASFSSPTLEPLLDHHTRRHFNFLSDTFPDLVGRGGAGDNGPEGVNESDHKSETTRARPSRIRGRNAPPVRFLRQVLERVSASLSGPTNQQVKVLEQAVKDLSRLSAQTDAFDGSQFARGYTECQLLFSRCMASKFWLNCGGGGGGGDQQCASIVHSRIDRMTALIMELKNRFIHVGHHEKQQVRLLKLQVMALQLVFTVKASNKSALFPTEAFLKEVEAIGRDPELVDTSHFVAKVLREIQGCSPSDQRKPGVVTRILLPVLMAHPVQPFDFTFGSMDEHGATNISDIRMSRAKVYEPSGNNEAPLKYTAGMVLAVPVDADLFNVGDVTKVRLALKTPDQKVILVTPKSSDFCEKATNCYRLFTSALMSHPVWSEALHVEISIVLDHSEDNSVASTTSGGYGGRGGINNPQSVPLCDPIKVLVLPKPIKRGM